MRDKHTKGPWETYAYEDEGSVGVCPKSGGDVADCSINTFRPFAERLANARLMAAAPDLLRELRVLIAVMDNGMYDEEIFERGRAAIAKATQP